ncbi:hypothetical protein [Aureispira sp. CCB-E]|uniref:hypothetical protein n=1 Tax=Aureispira sp. CCB-E TaxID=3051121 RepID=UPI0028686526|nr:hypothetical protein [Aureispira sp. CCB-E]WMX17073.1 hypothetical protein QP953_11885 [Aureispira sp. CCB-E]
MPFLIPFILGAGGTGFLWWQTKQKEEKEPHLGEDLWNALKPILIILLVLLFLRWLYKKGSIEHDVDENI